MIIRKFLLSALILFFFPGCSSEDSPAKSVESGTSVYYEDLRSVSTFVVDQSTGIVAPKRVAALSAFKPGDLTILSSAGEASAGTVWAEYKAGGLDEQLKALEAKESAYLEQIERFGEIELEMELNRLKQTLRESQNALSRLEAFEGVSESTASALSPNASISLEREPIETKIRLVRGQIDELEKHGRSREQRNRLADFNLQKDEIQARLNSRKLVVPFSGEVQYSDSLEAGTLVSITSPEALGTVIDYSEVFLRLEMASDLTATLDPEQIIVLVPSFPDLTLEFSHSKIEEVRSTMTRVHYFRFPQSHVGQLKDLVGKSLSARIAVALSEPARVISKAALLRAGRGQTWEARVQSIFPDRSIAYEGTYELAIR